jgi:cytochrome c biogenesis protein CcdA
MFPSFLAASVRNHRWRLVPLAFVFAAGVATVMLPVTLGLSLLTESLLRFHTAVYAAGALLLFGLAAVSLGGGTWSLPFLRKSPDISRTDSAGVYALGVFSGAASACCAPVLAGVLTLSALSPGLLSSAGISLAYVFGMVFPLVVMTLLWDRLRPGQTTFGTRQVSFGLGPLRVSTTSSGLAASAMFMVMGVVMAVVAFTGASLTPESTASLGRVVEDFLTPILDRLSWIPDPVVGLLLVLIAAGAVWLSARTRNRDHEHQEGTCHEHHKDTTTTR